MIAESAANPLGSQWFTTMLGKKASLAPVLAYVRDLSVVNAAAVALAKLGVAHALSHCRRCYSLANNDSMNNSNSTANDNNKTDITATPINQKSISANVSAAQCTVCAFAKIPVFSICNSQQVDTATANATAKAAANATETDSSLATAATAVMSRRRPDNFLAQLRTVLTSQPQTLALAQSAVRARDDHTNNSTHHAKPRCCGCADALSAFTATSTMNTPAKATVAFPLVVWYAYSQGEQTRWAVAWTFDPFLLSSLSRQPLVWAREMAGWTGQAEANAWVNARNLGRKFKSRS